MIFACQGRYPGCRVVIHRQVAEGRRPKYCKVCRRVEYLARHKRYNDQKKKIQPLRAKQLPEPYKTWLADHS